LFIHFEIYLRLKYQSFGGILIRSLEELKDGGETRASFIDGPSKCVDFVLEKADASSIHDLVSKRFPKADAVTGIHLPIEKPKDDDTYPLYLEHYTFVNKQKVLASSRVGMSLKKNDEHDARSRFVAKPYRYFIHADSIKKAKNQMVVSLYDRLVARALAAKNETDYSKLTEQEKKSIIETVSKDVGSGVAQSKKYIAQYEKGRENAVELSSDGKLKLTDAMKGLFGKKSLSSDELCQMHGILYKFL